MVGIDDAGSILKDDSAGRLLDHLDIFDMLNINPNGRRRTHDEFRWTAYIVKALLFKVMKLKSGEEKATSKQKALLSRMENELAIGYDYDMAVTFYKWMTAKGITEDERIEKLYARHGVGSTCSWEPLAVNPLDGRVHKELHEDHLPRRAPHYWKEEGADEENDARMKVVAEGLERRDQLRKQRREEVRCQAGEVDDADTIDLTSD